MCVSVCVCIGYNVPSVNMLGKIHPSGSSVLGGYRRGVVMCGIENQFWDEVAIWRRVEMSKSCRVGIAPGAQEISLDGDTSFDRKESELRSGS